MRRFGVLAAACVVLGATRGAANPHPRGANANATEPHAWLQGVLPVIGRGLALFAHESSVARRPNRRGTVLARRRRASTTVAGGRCDAGCGSSCDKGCNGGCFPCDKGCDGGCDNDGQPCNAACKCKQGKVLVVVVGWERGTQPHRVC